MKPIYIDWYLPHATHYHTFFFNKVATDGRFDLTVFYFEEVLAAYPWKRSAQRKFASEILQQGLGGIDTRLVWQKGMRDSRTSVVAGWSNPTTMILLTLWSIRGVPYFVYTDTPVEKERTGLRQKLRAAWLGWILRRAKGILVTGEWGRKMILGWNFNERVYNFPFVVDLDSFRPGAAVPKDDARELTIFSSGRLDINHKGYDVALDALAMIREQYPGLRLRWMIAGTGPDESLIREMARERQLDNWLDLLGWKESDELPGFYSQCDIFLHASRFDPFPNAVLEAMACGCLVVASNAAGSAVERIVDHETGFLFHSGSAASLAQQLSKAISLTPEERSMIRHNARTMAEKWHAGRNLELLVRLAVAEKGVKVPEQA